METMSNEVLRNNASTGLGRLLAALRAADGYLTLPELRDETNDPVASISANLRNLKKKEHGAHEIDKRLRGGSGNLWEYRLGGRTEAHDADSNA